MYHQSLCRMRHVLLAPSCSALRYNFSTSALQANAPGRVLVIAGPTAVGKSKLSIRLAQELNGEIISADATQVFQDLDIGTDKVSHSDRAKVPHYLLDVVPVTDKYSAGKFASRAIDICQDILARGKTPIVCGGSILYLKSMMSGPNNAPISNIALEEQIEYRLKHTGEWDDALAELAKVDPESAEGVLKNNWRHLRRALSVYEMTGKPLSEFKPEKPEHLEFFSCGIGMNGDALMNRISSRCEYIVDQGLVEEMLGLMLKYDLSKTKVEKMVGYQQVANYIKVFWLGPDAKTPARMRKHFAKFLDRYIRATRQLAATQIQHLNKEANSGYSSYMIDPFDTESTVEEIAADFRENTRRPSQPLPPIGEWSRRFELYGDKELVDAKSQQIQQVMLTMAHDMDWDASIIMSEYEDEVGEGEEKPFSRRMKRYRRRIGLD